MSSVSPGRDTKRLRVKNGAARNLNHPLDPDHVLQATAQSYYQRVTGTGIGENEYRHPFACRGNCDVALGDTVKIRCSRCSILLKSK